MLSKTVTLWILVTVLVISPLLSTAEEVVMQEDSSSDICAPFADGKVDAEMFQHMLDAASKGQLYQIEAVSSRMGFCIDTPLGLIEGKFKEFKGGFTIEPDKNGVSGQAMMVVETESMEVPGQLIHSLLESESFLDSEHYPEMLFVSRGFYWLNDKEAVLVGDLTIRDVTKQVGFHVVMEEQEEEPGESSQRIYVKASTKIRRSEFGIISMAPMVSDDLSLCMRVEAVRYQDTGNS